jgi:hypothetical protein
MPTVCTGQLAKSKGGQIFALKLHGPTIRMVAVGISRRHALLENSPPGSLGIAAPVLANAILEH